MFAHETIISDLILLFKLVSFPNLKMFCRKNMTMQSV